MNQLTLKVKQRGVLDGLYEVEIRWKGEKVDSKRLALDTLIQRRGSTEAVETYLNTKKGFSFATGETKEKYMKYVRLREKVKHYPPSIGW